MNISLTSELENFIQLKVDSGFYHSASEVVRDGLRLLYEQDQLKKKRLELLDKEIEKGLLSVEKYGLISGDAVYNELLARRKDA